MGSSGVRPCRNTPSGDGPFAIPIPANPLHFSHPKPKIRISLKKKKPCSRYSAVRSAPPPPRRRRRGGDLFSPRCSPRRLALSTHAGALLRRSHRGGGRSMARRAPWGSGPHRRRGPARRRGRPSVGTTGWRSRGWGSRRGSWRGSPHGASPGSSPSR